MFLPPMSHPKMYSKFAVLKRLCMSVGIQDKEILSSFCLIVKMNDYTSDD